MGMRCCCGLFLFILYLSVIAQIPAKAETTSPAASEIIPLENEFYRLEFSHGNGALLRLHDKRGGIDLKAPTALAENFRLLVPVPNKNANYILGKENRISQSQFLPNGLLLRWDAPLKDTRGVPHDIAVTMTIAFENQSVVFRLELDNHSDQTVKEVWYPRVGGLLGFGTGKNAAEAVLNPPPNNGKRLQLPFGEHSSGYPGMNMAFMEVDNPALNRGLYLGAHDEVARFKVFMFEEVTVDDAADVQAGLIHFPFIGPGGHFEGSPFVLQFHDGDWVDGGRTIYRKWFKNTFGLMTPERDWIRQHGFFQMIMIMLPEGNINYTIDEIPRIARDGLKYGVTSLQIAGWQRGGHDNGYPYYEPDPRLGTWEDLRNAISTCHDMGVKIYFFVNIHVNNMDTEWYKRELKDYNFERISGDPAWIAGWGMGTLASRMGLTTPRMASGDPSFPRLRDGQLKYFRKLAEVGADGIHIDKFFPQPLNLNPRIVMSPDQSPWEGSIQLVEMIDRECRALNPDFRISFECNWDRLLQYGDATWWAGNMSIARQIFPELVETVGLYQPYDYRGVNDAVRQGIAVMVSPHHFNRSMDYITWRGLSRYIHEVKRIRDTFADTFFLGEYLGSKGCRFADNKRPPGLDYGCFRNLVTGVHGCILTNNSDTPIAVQVAGLSDRASPNVSIHCPFKDPVATQLPATVTIEPEQIAFILEAEQ